MFKSFDPKELPTAKLHDYMLSTIAPRPIAWASTIDNEGNVNLSPFSFFNCFGSNPPILVFSPSRRVRDNTTKHTLENVHEVAECVINIVSYDIVGKMALTSAEFERDINEFGPAELTMEPSLKVRPPRVKESPAQYECIVKEVKPLGEGGGAGNLIICEVVHVHLSEHIFNEEGNIDPMKVDNVARMGKIWYSRAKEGLFELPNPRDKEGIGFSRLPAFVRESKYLTGNELARLASVSYLPSAEEVAQVRDSSGMKEIHKHYSNADEYASKVFNLAKTLVNENKVEEAWRVLMSLQ